MRLFRLEGRSTPRWLILGLLSGLMALACSSSGSRFFAVVVEGEQGSGGIFLSEGTLPGAGPQSTATLEIEVFVVDPEGQIVADLEAEDFSIESFEADGATLDFTPTGFSVATSSASTPYSAYLLIDQTADMPGIDPNGDRVAAARVFLENLATDDEATVGAFACDESATPPPVCSSVIERFDDFSTDGSVFFDALDALLGEEEGITPLFDATIVATDDTASLGINGTLALVVLDGGIDNASVALQADAIANAQTDGVALYPVGLNPPGRLGVVDPDRDFDLADPLAAMAQDTGGAYLIALDAAQLVSYYAALGGVLRGSVVVYSLSFDVTASAAVLSAGTAVLGNLAVDLGDVLTLPFVSEFQ